MLPRTTFLLILAFLATFSVAAAVHAEDKAESAVVAGVVPDAKNNPIKAEPKEQKKQAPPKAKLLSAPKNEPENKHKTTNKSVVGKKDKTGDKKDKAGDKKHKAGDKDKAVEKNDNTVVNKANTKKPNKKASKKESVEGAAKEQTLDSEAQLVRRSSGGFLRKLQRKRTEGEAIKFSNMATDNQKTHKKFLNKRSFEEMNTNFQEKAKNVAHKIKQGAKSLFAKFKGFFSR